jgi:hypothetical protein
LQGRPPRTPSALIGHKTLDVQRQGAGAFITPIAAFLQTLHDNSVELAAQYFALQVFVDQEGEAVPAAAAARAGAVPRSNRFATEQATLLALMQGRRPG